MNSLTIHQKGLLMTIVGVLILTPDALLVRLVDADEWTLVFWRSLFAAISFFILSAIIEKTYTFTSIKHAFNNTLWCALLFAGSNVFFVFSIANTAVANTLVILASMPFIGAVLTIIFIGKNVSVRTWTAIFFSMLGIVIVFWGRLGSGNIYGDIFAVFAAICMAATFVAVNINPKINTLVAVGFGSAISSVTGLLMSANPMAVSVADMGVLVVNGGIIFPIAMGLITFGPKLISAPEVSLIMLLETVLGPLWVWLVLSEVPVQQTFIGGIIVISAVLINACLEFIASGKVKSIEK